MQPTIEKAVEAHKSGQLAEAEALYRAILQVQPLHPDANHNLGVLAVSVNKTALALPLFKVALEANPKQGQFWLSYVDALIKVQQIEIAKNVVDQAKKMGVIEGVIVALEAKVSALLPNLEIRKTEEDPLTSAIQLRELGRYKEAQEWINFYLASHSNSSEAWSLLSQVLLLDKQEVASAKALETALSINPELPSIYRNKARLLLRQAKPVEALNMASSGFSKSYKDPESLVVLAACLIANKRDIEALTLIEQSLQLQPSYAEAFVNRALIRLNGQDQKGAMKDLEAALSLKPHLGQVWGVLGSLRYQISDLSGAIQALQELDKLEPTNVKNMVILGEFLRQANRKKEAIFILERATELEPENASAWTNLGTTWQQLGSLENAKAAYEKSLAINPKSAEVSCNLGSVEKDAGNWESARKYFEQSIKVNPNLVQVHSNLGITLINLGRLEEAEMSFRNSIRLKPDDARAHNNLGNALKDLGRLEDAAISFRHATLLKPDFAQAHSDLGITLKDLGRLEDAERSFRHSIEIKPSFAQAHSNLGATLKDLGRLEEAEFSYRKAVELDPKLAQAHYNLGNTLNDLGKRENAEASYRQAIDLSPADAKIHNNLGNLLKDLDRLEEAEASYRQAISLNPDDEKNYNNLGNVLQDLGQLEEAEVSYKQAISLKPEYHTALSNLLFLQSHISTNSAEKLFEMHCGFGQQFEAPLRPFWQSHTNNLDPVRKLRIGFVSGDFREHAVVSCIEPILMHLSTYESLSLHAYHNNHLIDLTSKRLEGYFSSWDRVSHFSDEKLAEKIRADAIDILIDLSGHTAHNRLTVFARKPAPLQATWIGYPGTTGLQSMDYYLCDDQWLPHEKFASQFTEQLAYLPATAAFLPASNAPDVNDLPALRKGYVTFGSFNRMNKVTQLAIHTWAEVLRAVPQSKMLIGNVVDDQNEQRISDMFAQVGVAADRFYFRPRSDMHSYLALHSEVDVCLDTLQYGGGTTVFHSLWMGVPTITLAGDTPASCQATCILQHCGLDDFVSNDLQGFVHASVSAVSDLQGLSKIRAGMRDRLSASTVMQPALVTKGLERVLRLMWERWCVGLPAKSIESNDRQIS